MDDLIGQITATMLVSLRFAPMFAFAAPFTLLRIPPTVRVLIAVALAGWLVAGSPGNTVDRLAQGGDLVGLAAGELIVGLAMALTLQLAFAAILWVGQAVDNQAGFGFAAIADPATNEQMPLAGAILSYAAAAIFFTTGAQYDLLALIAASVETLPLGYGVAQPAIDSLLTYLGTLFALALGLVGIVMLALFLIDVTIAFMSRTLPQMNVLLLGFQVKSMAMLVILPITIALSGAATVRLIRLALENAPRLIVVG